MRDGRERISSASVSATVVQECLQCDSVCVCVCVDPVKAERYQDGVLLARERMQASQDRLAAEHSCQSDEVLAAAAGGVCVCVCV